MRTVILPLDSNIENAHPKDRLFYRAYATNPVSTRISSFLLNQNSRFGCKSRSVCVRLCVSLFFFTATSVLFKIPFLHRQRICIQKCKPIYSAGPLPLKSCTQVTPFEVSVLQLLEI